MISKNGANITSAHTETKDRGLVETHFSLLVKGVEQLDSLIAAIKKLKAVSDVKRLGMCSSGEE